MTVISPLLLWSLGGCVQSVFFPPDLWPETTADTGRGRNNDNNNGRLGVSEITSGCDLDGTSWITEIRTTGWIHTATLDMMRLEDQVSEEHPFTLVDSDPNGAWDLLRVGPLAPATQPESQVPGVSSQFRCSEDEDKLSYAVRIWDGASTLLDCVVWGADPSGATAAVRAIDPGITTLGGCRELEAMSLVP